MDGQKDALRKRIRSALDEISPAQRIAASGQLRTRLQEHPVWKNAKSVLFFAPLANEADVWPLLEGAPAAGKDPALPRFDARQQGYVACRVQNLPGEIVTGRFGIREPSAGCPEILLHVPDLILVPGVAFDLSGHRLGRGKGYYDRLLAKARGVKCGVAFDEQIVKAVAAGTHDIRMDFILTPTRVIKT